ncbi:MULTISPECIES: glycosyltransferase [unclassified Microbacterium]|uniref:glycosyltransferase n=1 Tax=unclassified Microbacterium TaxID=2609290 RepID=UPI000EA96C95|nr:MULTISPECIES: glycosyltransferase family 2 protein [unclassified Microbacterium]MBT2483979.1 glycosyltransferase family 2 protein [Microbacterium sp. ISL-108]RKN66944.1 glycosyltransferase [Microbacterium sp. CGR2]
MIAILSAFTLLLGVTFVAYVVSILVPFLRHRPVAEGNPHEFEWHIFIPCRDEAVVIDQTIARARNDFPMAHVWVIDDDSDDETAAITESHALVDDHVHLVRRVRPNARTGKGDALNSAYDALQEWLPADADHSRVIVAVVDADGELAPNALEVVSSPEIFGESKTGAAQIAVWMKNRDDPRPLPDQGRLANAFARNLIRMQDLEFRTVISGMQALRARTGTVGLGGNGQFTRLDVLDAIGRGYGRPWHGALLEDYELGVHVMLAGYEVRHVYDTHVSQEALPSLRRLLTQRTRWAQGNIQCVKYLKDIFNSSNVDTGGVIESAYYLLLPFLQILGGIALLILTGTAIAFGIQHPDVIESNIGQVWGLLALNIIFSVTPFAIWGIVYKLKCEPEASWARALFWGLEVWLYVYNIYICIARAFVRVARGKNGWSKTRRNAEAHVVVAGSVAVEQ